MSSERDHPPIYASRLLWGVVALVALVGGIAGGPLTGVALLLGSLGGVIAIVLVASGLDRLRGLGEPKYDNKIDPWDN